MAERAKKWKSSYFCISDGVCQLLVVEFIQQCVSTFQLDSSRVIGENPTFLWEGSVFGQVSFLNNVLWPGAWPSKKDGKGCWVLGWRTFSLFGASWKRDARMLQGIVSSFLLLHKKVSKPDTLQNPGAKRTWEPPNFFSPYHLLYCGHDSRSALRWSLQFSKPFWVSTWLSWPFSL